MRILIVGGTVFLGRHLVEAAKARGHDITLFNRGKSNPDLFPDVEQIHGDRLEGFQALQGRDFDCVIDTCGFFPRAVKISREAFPNAHYIFISTISVFKDASKPGLDETSEVATIEDEAIEEVTGETYGPLKALCEKVLRETPGKWLVVRPGLIVGPWDKTDRFTYWPVRFYEAGAENVLAPDVKDQPVQIIDVRDLAEWTIHLAEQKAEGTFSGTGPAAPTTLQTALEQIRQAVNPAAKITWVSTDLLTREEVQPWSDLPMVLDYNGSMNGMLQVNLEKSFQNGLKLRPIAETAKDTLDWWISQGQPELKPGLKRERELEILRKSE